MTTGLGYDYRESLEISIGRLFSLLSLDSGIEIDGFMVRIFNAYTFRPWKAVCSGGTRWIWCIQGVMVSTGRVLEYLYRQYWTTHLYNMLPLNNLCTQTCSIIFFSEKLILILFFSLVSIRRSLPLRLSPSLTGPIVSWSSRICLLERMCLWRKLFPLHLLVCKYKK